MLQAPTPDPRSPSLTPQRLCGVSAIACCTPGRPDDVRVVPGEGMPNHGDAANKGRLLIVFNVAFPDPGFCDVAQLPALGAHLPPAPAFEEPAGGLDGEGVEVVEMQPYTKGSDRGPGDGEFSGTNSRSAYEEDAGEGGGGGGECALQ